MENGFHLAVPNDVYALLGVFFPCGIDLVRLYTPYTRRAMK